MIKHSIFKWIGLIVIFTLLISAGANPVVKAQDTTPNPDGSSAPEGDAPSAPVEPSMTYPGGTTAYESGWVSINPGQVLTLTHNLGGSLDNYIVDLRFYSASSTGESHGFNQIMYGGNQFYATAPVGYSPNDNVGGFWSNLTTSTIKIFRLADDITYMVKFRVRIWVESVEDWDSGWQAITAGNNYTGTFGIPSGSADNYLVYLEFKDTGTYMPPASSIGIHQRYYGGFSVSSGDGMVGAYWRSLTNTSITVYLRDQETRIDQVRVRIWNQSKPTYDSDWVNATPNIYTYLVHNIGGSPDDYIVDLQFKDVTWGINQRCYGGCDLRAKDGAYANQKAGAYWRKLTKSSIEVGRRADDTFAVQVRVRIWHFWKPSRPAFDSGWKSANVGIGYTNYHQLGGNEDDYMVYLTFKDPTYWVHQMYYGTNVFGASFPTGYAANEDAGAYWHALDINSISIHRAANDDQSDQYRVLIWRTPKPDYDTGWVTVAQNSGYSHIHNLGGNVKDYLVDLTCKTSGGDINQLYYGSQHLADNTRVGAYYWGLDTTNVWVYRQTNDAQCNTHRLRIWRMGAPAYTSDYFPINPSGYVDSSHNLGLGTEKYLVDVTAHNAGGDHKMFYGRVDYGTSPQGGGAENDRLGYMWYALNGSMIRTYRLPEDTTVETLNVRIWTLPTTIFLPIALK